MEYALTVIWKEIVTQAVWALVFPPFGSLVPAEMYVALSPPSFRKEFPGEDLPREAFSTSRPKEPPA